MEKFYKGEIQRLFPILEAIKEGKTIQWNDMGLWRDIDGDEEGFFLDTLIGKPDGYRIKPEPKFRPFNNKEECWKEMLQHNPLGWFKDKKAKEFFTLNCISDKDPKIKTYEYLFNDCVFMDGSICGVKLEE
jgi:hypothetical protein